MGGGVAIGCLVDAEVLWWVLLCCVCGGLGGGGGLRLGAGLSGKSAFEWFDVEVGTVDEECRWDVLYLPPRCRSLSQLIW